MRRNPNRYGSITKLSGSRSRPWMIRVTVFDEDGFGRQVPIDYAKTEEEARIILAQYNDNPWSIDRNRVMLADLYQRWLDVKAPKLSPANQHSLKSAYRHLSKYYGAKYRTLRAYHMQDCIDNCGLSYSTQAAIKALWGHLDAFAFECDIIVKMYSQLTTSSPTPDTTRTPFTLDQVESLWKIETEPWVDTVLIFIYTGFRITELLTMQTDQIDLQDMTFRGGIKTAAGKGRIVPIHPKILPFVREWVEKGKPYLFTFNGKKLSSNRYYKFWGEVMDKINAKKTPHEARHTFETLLDNAGGNRKCIDLLMGHKSSDIGNRTYNHKTLEQLRETILLLP